MHSNIKYWAMGIESCNVYEVEYLYQHIPSDSLAIPGPFRIDQSYPHTRLCVMIQAEEVGSGEVVMEEGGWDRPR